MPPDAPNELLVTPSPDHKALFAASTLPHPPFLFPGGELQRLLDFDKISKSFDLGVTVEASTIPGEEFH
jgi:hypothetical protein